MEFKTSICTNKLQAVYGEKGSIDIAKKLGVTHIDFPANRYCISNPDSIYSKSDDEIISYFKDIKDYADKQGISIGQTHGRFRIFMNDEELDNRCLENARRDLLATSVLGAPVCVIHGITTSVMGIDADPQVMRDLCFEKFNHILKWAKEYNVKVATETFGSANQCTASEFFGNAQEFKNIYERIASHGDNADYFTVCIDTGHINDVVRFNNPSVGDFIRMFPGKISCIHLHDNDGINDLHIPPCAGNIDWDDVFNALEEVGYNGIYNLEINLSRFGEGFEIETADFSVKVLKFLLKKRNKSL